MFTKITHLRNSVTYVEAKGKLDIYNTEDYLEEIKDTLKIRHLIVLVLQHYLHSIGTLLLTL